MLVAVESLQKKIPIKLKYIGRIARTILKKEGVRPIGSSPQGTSGLREESSLNITFVSSPKIRSLNRQYLHRDYVTDVLAFDLRDQQLQELTLLFLRFCCGRCLRRCSGCD